MPHCWRIPDADRVSLSVGFYYMANALRPLLVKHALLSGAAVASRQASRHSLWGRGRPVGRELEQWPRRCPGWQRRRRLVGAREI
jgi:hypothetical protein